MEYNEIKTFDELLLKVKSYITNEEELNTIRKAYEYSYNVHKDTKRLSGEDYILHPLNVAYLLTSLDADSDLIATALLHDVINKGNDNINNVKKEFNDEIVKLLIGITRINNISLSADSESNVNYYKKILVGLTEDVRIIILKIVERLQNLRTLWAIDKNKQKEKAKETLEIIVPIAHRLGLSEIKSELEVLSLKYYKPNAYKSVELLFDNTKEERENLLNNMKSELENLLDSNNIEYKIKGRVKSIYSIYNKLRKGKKFSQIYDIYALRIILNEVSECYQVLGLIHSKYKPYPKRFKDYIANPKNNMYQSLHTTVFGPEGKPFEVQIRTKEMDEVAEKGIASHWSYKEQGKKVEFSMEHKLEVFRNIMDLDNDEFVSEVENQILGTSIYVYTPKGDVIELPEGSTPVDFAFRVHTKVGETIVGAIVNDNIASLNTVLKTGDVVKINTNKNSTPSLEWLNFVKTNQAKNKIKTYFSKQKKEDAILKGKDLLAKDLRRKKVSALDFNERLQIIYDEIKIDNENDLYYYIGTGKYTPTMIINMAYKEEKAKEELLLDRIQNKDVIKNTDAKNDILVSGIDEIKVSLANCCKPIKGDEIVGYISKGNGIIVHHKNCKNVGEERIINVEWNNNITRLFKVKLLITTDLKDNILYDIITFSSTNNVNIVEIKSVMKNYEGFVDLTIEIKDSTELKKFILSLEQLPYVKNVDRIFE